MQDKAQSRPAGAVRKVVDYARAEPVAFQGLIQTGLALLLGFGLITWTTEQTGLALALTAAILTVIARRQVTPNARVAGDPHSATQPAHPAPAEASSKGHG